MAFTKERQQLEEFCTGTLQVLNLFPTIINGKLEGQTKDAENVFISECGRVQQRIKQMQTELRVAVTKLPPSVSQAITDEERVLKKQEGESRETNRRTIVQEYFRQLWQEKKFSASARKEAIVIANEMMNLRRGLDRMLHCVDIDTCWVESEHVLDFKSHNPREDIEFTAEEAPEESGPSGGLEPHST